MTTKQKRIQLTPSEIPNLPNFDVKDSSFFTKWSHLPSPEEVRAQAKAQHLAGINPDERKVYSMDGLHVRPPPVLFEHMGLLVKWGIDTRISEAQCLYAIGRFIGDSVPVPEVYGWRTDGDERFIYMEHVQGQTLEQVWDTMEPNERSAVCCELRASLEELRQIEQDSLDPFIGSITRGPLYDRAIAIGHMSEAGAFATVLDFHNWFTFLHRRRMPDPYSVPIEPFRHELPDDSAIVFTHNDFHRSNIIVTPSRPYRLLAIVDWEQSGWLPAYWEARKALWSVGWEEEWATTYLPMILELYDSTWEPWDYYTLAMGC